MRIERRQSAICTINPITLVLAFWTAFACLTFATKRRTTLTIHHYHRLPWAQDRHVHSPGPSKTSSEMIRATGRASSTRLKQDGSVVNDARPPFRQSETRPSSFRSSIIRSRIMAAFSNSRFLAAAFMSDSSCLISSTISSPEMEVTA